MRNGKKMRLCREKTGGIFLFLRRFNFLGGSFSQDHSGYKLKNH